MNQRQIIIFLIAIFIGCTATIQKRDSSNLKPTVINYPLNEDKIPFYSKDKLSFDQVIKNFNGIKYASHQIGNNIKKKVVPIYPLEIIENTNLDTTVVLKVHIDSENSIKSVIILNSGGIYLDNNCIDAIRQFEIRRLSDEQYFFTITIRFKYEEN